MFIFFTICVTVTWRCILPSFLFCFCIKTLMLNLTNCMQILHNLSCWSVCHSFRRLLVHLQPETHSTQTGTKRVCGTGWVANTGISPTLELQAHRALTEVLGSETTPSWLLAWQALYPLNRLPRPLRQILQKWGKEDPGGIWKESYLGKESYL